MTIQQILKDIDLYFSDTSRPKEETGNGLDEIVEHVTDKLNALAASADEEFGE